MASPLSRVQKRLGAIDGDHAGYPNGRRPGDEVVDISLRVVMGAQHYTRVWCSVMQV